MQLLCCIHSVLFGGLEQHQQVNSTGGINTERSAKGLKHDILSLKRNRLSDDQALVLYRSAENIRHLMNARKEYCTSNSLLGNSSK